MKAHPAEPEYSIGDTVNFTDRHGRSQTGEVRRIEASWNDWGSRKPHITFTVRHPTYHRGVEHIGIDAISGLAAAT